MAYILTWPLSNVVTAIRKPEDEEKPVMTPVPAFHDARGHFNSACVSWRSVFIASVLVYCRPYPTFDGSAKVWSLSWMLPILVRNLLGTLLICGFWDWFLYFSPLAKKMYKYKIKSKYPSFRQMKHDVFYTFVSSCMAAVVECFLCHYWTTGKLKMDRSLRERPLFNLFMGSFIVHLRFVHFYVYHRGMHPWHTKRFFDLGKFLYHFHSLHHKSYNTTAFSGTSMHPVEGLTYYSAALLPCLMGAHPVFAVATIVDCAMGAWMSHDGFQWPGSGDDFHLWHHLYCDGNYGSKEWPFDLWMGTYIGEKGDLKKIWKDQPTGRECSGTKLHPQSSKEDKVE